MEPVNWGVLSTSNFAQERSLPAMQQGKLSRIAAICSRDLGAAQAGPDRRARRSTALKPQHVLLQMGRW